MDYIVNDVENMKVYFPDLVFDEFILEIYGDYWHGNPKIYDENSTIIGDLIAKDKWDMDRVRVDRIESITKKPVFIWWESDIIELGLDKLLIQLNEDLKIEKHR